MPRALLILLLLRFRAWLRRMGRTLATARGAALAVLVLVFIVVPGLSGLFVGRLTHQAPPDDETVRMVVSLILLGLTLMMCISTSPTALSFRPNEIDFLFPGPFTRRQLLTYKILERGLLGVFVAVFIGLYQLRHFASAPAALAGIWLAFTFIQLVAIEVTLLRKALADPSSSRSVRAIARVVIGALAVAAVAGVAHVVMLARAGGEWSFEAVATAARKSAIVAPMLAPFDVFAMVMTARHLGDFAIWTAAAAILIVIVFALIVRLDAYFIETSLAASRKLTRRIEAMRRGGTAMGTSTMRVSLPLPRLGGAGPTAWRQLIGAIRNYRSLLLVLLITGFAAMPMLVMAVTAEAGARSASFPIMVGFFAGFFLVFIGPQMLRFDFRADVDAIDSLKAMPIPSRAVVAGELLTPTLVLAGIGTLLVITGAASIGVPPAVAIAAVLLLIPAAALITAVENLVFLVYPVRLPHGGPADFTVMARTMVSFLFKMLILLPVGGAVGAAWVIGLLLAGHWAAGAAGAWLVLCLAVAAAVPILARVYDRFDVSMDTPPA